MNIWWDRCYHQNTDTEIIQTCMQRQTDIFLNTPGIHKAKNKLGRNIWVECGRTDTERCGCDSVAGRTDYLYWCRWKAYCRAVTEDKSYAGHSGDQQSRYSEKRRYFTGKCDNYRKLYLNLRKLFRHLPCVGRIRKTSWTACLNICRMVKISTRRRYGNRSATETDCCGDHPWESTAYAGWGLMVSL